jgi:hypothetical protein
MKVSHVITALILALAVATFVTLIVSRMVSDDPGIDDPVTATAGEGVR